MAGFMIAAPHSGNGKTVMTLSLLRALKRRGIAFGPAKAGPDYIDPAFHAQASGETCINLDGWAMRPDLVRALAAGHGAGRLLVVEAMMGLYDGAADGSASAADLAAMLGLPVLFVIDCSRMAQSVAALVSGYAGHRPDVTLAGIILNRVGSARHEAMLRAALEPLSVPVIAAVPRHEGLGIPSRHLGLVQAQEHADFERFADIGADLVEAHFDLDRLLEIAGGYRGANAKPVARLEPLGQHVAVACDGAFGFIYPHLIDGWRSAGAELSFFSPLADEGPDTSADAVFLPGGYPELHAGQIAAAENFRSGMQAAVRRGATVYGECGGYMVLGDRLTDSEGTPHAMLGLLRLETSFARRQRHLGYRRLSPIGGRLFSELLNGHEFHYSVAEREEGEPLFAVRDALGADLGRTGLREGWVMGSYMHVIDRAGS